MWSSDINTKTTLICQQSFEFLQNDLNHESIIDKIPKRSSPSSWRQQRSGAAESRKTPAPSCSTSNELSPWAVEDAYLKVTQEEVRFMAYNAASHQVASLLGSSHDIHFYVYSLWEASMIPVSGICLSLIDAAGVPVA